MWINWFIWIGLYICQGFIQFSRAADLIPCEKGWLYFRDKCYKLGGKRDKGRSNWNLSSSKCASVGGNLATVDSNEVQEFLVTFLLMDAKTSAWIGLNSRENRSVYVWEDGAELYYDNWRTYDPYPPIEEWGQCVEMAIDFYNNLTGQWNDIECSQWRAYICETRKSKKLSPDPRFCSGTQRGWKHQNTCYHVVSEKKTWDDAEKHCQETFNGHLLTVLDLSVDVFVEYILPNIEVWIGIKVQEQPLQQWASGWYVGYSEWDKDERQDFFLGTCSVRSKRGLWKKVPCSSSYSFICEAPSVGPPVLKQPVKGSKCPNLPGKWLDLGGEYCYYFDIMSNVDWYKANFDCVRRGGSLASIHSEEESLTIHQFIKYTQRHLHIGLIRHVDTYLSEQNVFVWADGSPMDYKNWGQHEPNSEDENCGELLTETMTWNDLNCKTEAGFICSVKKVLPNANQQANSPTSPNVFGQTDWPSGLSFKVVIGVSICTLLVVNLIWYIAYRFRTRRVQRKQMSTGVELHPAVPASQRPGYPTKEDNDYYENMN